MPALSKKQQKFMGIVRSIQKGEQPASKFSKEVEHIVRITDLFDLWISWILLCEHEPFECQALSYYL